MSARSCTDRPSLLFLFKAWAAWLFSAVFFLLVFGLLIEYSSCSSTHMAYLCSLLSFLASVSAGLIAVRSSRLSYFVTGVACALSTLALLLLVGLLFDRKSFDSGAVLSLVSFTLSGYLVGAFFSGKTRKKHRSAHTLRHGKRRGMN